MFVTENTRSGVVLHAPAGRKRNVRNFSFGPAFSIGTYTWIRSNTVVALSATIASHWRISASSWWRLTRPAWVARKNRSFTSVADAVALNAAATAVSSDAVIARLIISSTRLSPRPRRAVRGRPGARHGCRGAARRTLMA